VPCPNIKPMRHAQTTRSTEVHIPHIMLLGVSLYPFLAGRRITAFLTDRSPPVSSRITSIYPIGHCGVGGFRREVPSTARRSISPRDDPNRLSVQAPRGLHARLRCRWLLRLEDVLHADDPPLARSATIVDGTST
jgi:hypothetical protein